MSEEQTTTRSLEELKELARSMDINFHPSISAETLQARIQEHIDGERLQAVAAETAAAPQPVVESEAAKAERIKANALKLVRIRVACMNPAKQAYEGELFCAGNRYTGMVKKYVPFNVEWHVPQIILNMLQERKCQVFARKKVKTSSGVLVDAPQGKLIKEFAIEVLPPLTEAERKELAQRQAMRSGSAGALEAA